MVTKLFKAQVPEIALDPRPAGPSGVSETEFDLEELTAEGVEDPDIVDSPVNFEIEYEKIVLTKDQFWRDYNNQIKWHISF